MKAHQRRVQHNLHQPAAGLAEPAQPNGIMQKIYRWTDWIVNSISLLWKKCRSKSVVKNIETTMNVVSEE